MKTKIIGLKDLRENMDSYISEVKKGKSFTVVRRSKPIFKVSPVDEWGDDGTWETVLDFSNMKGGGMKAEDFLKRLKHG
jgi:prevent-host-death family protein